MAFDMKPLEINEFSGGMTDTYITAGPSKYLYADNFWITTDKNLIQRYGTNIIDSVAFSLGGLLEPVRGLYTLINDTVLLGQSGRNIYNYVKGIGNQVIASYTGNETLGGGDIQSSVIGTEWHRHMYFTSDAQAIPTKVYRDQNSVWQARTAGLPRAYGAANITNDQILGKAINLANDIRNSMINHIQDLFQHTVLDKVALNYFIAQTFQTTDEQPPAGVVQAPAATDLPSLELLIGNLNAAYEHQRADASLNGSRFYHTNMLSYAGNGAYITPTGMHVRVSNSVAPTNLTICAASIDDLAQKWYWHRYAVWTHSIINDPNVLARYAVTNPKVGQIVSNGAPVLTGNFVDAYNFVNNLKFYYNSHLMDADLILSTTPKIMHKFVDAQVTLEPWTCNIPDCFDYDSYANLIFWLRCLYSLHYNDMVSQYFYVGIFNTTAGSGSVTNYLYRDSTATLVIASPDTAAPAENVCTGNNFLIQSAGAGAGHPADTWASNSGFNTGTLRRYVFGFTTTGQIAQISKSQYHVAKDTNGNFINAKTSAAYNIAGTTNPFQPASSSQITSQIDSVGTDAKSWLAYATEFFYAFAAHFSDATAHIQIHTQGYPSFSGLPVPVTSVYTAPHLPFFVPTIASYSYAFIFTNTYTVEPNGLEYEVQSNPVYTGPVESGTIIPPTATLVSQFVNVYPNATYVTAQPLSITNLPTIVNTANTSYDTSYPAVIANPTLTDPTSNTGTSLDIYRTSDGGVTYYLVKQLQLGTTSYSDQTADSASYPGYPQLNTSLPLYTSGGVVGNDQPPQAACMTMLNGYMYYGNVISYGQAFPNRVMQSLPNAPDSVPATFYDDLDDAIVGLAATRSVVVAFCSKSLYRLTGQFNSLGQGLITHEKISNAIGCVSTKSIVQTEIGVFFAGTDGFYYTDGYQLIKITIDLNARYAGITQTANQQKRIVGAYDRFNRRVYWTVQQNTTDTNQDSIWVFYLDYGVKPDGVFTTHSSTTNMRPSSVAIYNQTLIYGHEKGYLFKFDPNIKTDPVVVPGAAPSTWQETYMPYNYQGAALTFNSLFARKWTTKIHIMGNNVGNNAMQVQSINDNDLATAAMLPVIKYTFNPMWGQPQIVWNKPSAQQAYNWEYDSDVDFWLRFPAGNMRCDLKQIVIQPAFVGIYRSEDWPPFCFAATNNGTKAVTIATPTGYTSIVWPLDIVGMSFAFSTDGYVQTWTILSVSGNSAVVSDPGNTLTTASNLGWVIRGYQKNSRVSITGIVVYYDYLGDKNSQYLGKGSQGENV